MLSTDHEEPIVVRLAGPQLLSERNDLEIKHGVRCHVCVSLCLRLPTVGQEGGPLAGSVNGQGGTVQKLKTSFC